jgi:hypothetical protein
MASNPSQNLALELMTTGEKSGQWGDITNINMQIVDRATKGVGTITLTTTSYSLDTVDYTASEGHYAVLVFAGTPGGTCTVTINPNDQQKVFIVRNTTPSSVVLTQGSGGNVTIAAGKATVVYATGAGSGAAVVDITPLLSVLQPSNNLSDVASATTARTNLGLAIGTDVQAYDAALQSIAGLTTSADQLIYTTGSDTYATSTLTAFGRSLVDDADSAAARTTLGLVIGTNVLAFDSNLQSFVTTFTLPTTDGTSGQFLQTNGSATLSFVTPSINTLSDGRVVGTSIGLGSGALAAISDTNALNVAVGVDALSSATGPFTAGNTAVGWSALKSGNPSSTTAVGHKAGEVGGALQSVFVGWEAGASISGQANVAVGYQSLREVGATGNFNTAVGHTSGRTATTGSQNVFLGYSAGFTSADPKSLTTGSNNILIGSSAMPSAATVSNEITIGNSSHNVVRFPGTTVVGSLPSASTVGAGARSFVTDATATTFASIVAGGGANGVPVYSDGTNWRIG